MLKRPHSPWQGKKLARLRERRSTPEEQLVALHTGHARRPVSESLACDAPRSTPRTAKRDPGHVPRWARVSRGAQVLREASGQWSRDAKAEAASALEEAAWATTAERTRRARSDSISCPLPRSPPHPLVSRAAVTRARDPRAGTLASAAAATAVQVAGWASASARGAAQGERSASAEVEASARVAGSVSAAALGRCEARAAA